MGTPTTEPVAGGLLLVDKPAGFTSHDVVALIRRATHTRRVGHTGTLDPFATGLLVVLVGHGTRLVPYVDGEPKLYEATVRFGAETDTDDATGRVAREATPADDAAVAAALPHLTGVIDQVPPAYSAKQVAGRRAYDAARRGDALTLPPARVTVHEWTILARRGSDLDVRVSCAGGTYIRALARDLGRLTGSAAHLVALRRLRSGPFGVAQAVSIDEVRAGAIAPLPLIASIPSMAVQAVDADDVARVRQGRAVAARSAGADGTPVALVAGAGDEQTLIAVAERAGGELRPKVVLGAD
jgi:tRNA pseudouridine55 synthase